MPSGQVMRQMAAITVDEFNDQAAAEMLAGRLKAHDLKAHEKMSWMRRSLLA